MYLSRKRFLPDIAGSQFAALSRNSSASYKTNINNICPTKVGGNITSLVGSRREWPGAFRRKKTSKLGRINWMDDARSTRAIEDLPGYPLDRMTCAVRDLAWLPTVQGKEE